jgi:hypothetical protein
MLTTDDRHAADRYGDTPDDHRTRLWASALLHAGSRLLDRLADRLAVAPRDAPRERVIEYHAEAGAPEGALYVDGRLVGHVLGVTRL